MGSNQMMMARLVDKYIAAGMSYEEAFDKASRETAVHTVEKKLEPKKPSRLELLWYGKDWNKKAGQKYPKGRAYKE